MSVAQGSTVNAAVTVPAHRGRRHRPITPADVRAQARALLRARWPGANAEFIGRRTVARYRAEAAAGNRPGDLETWLRTTLYEIVVEDQRADRGQSGHGAELDALLTVLAWPSRQRLDGWPLNRSVLSRAIGHLHARDLIVVRQIVLGESRTTIGRRLGIGVGEVDRTYDRARARLRATIGADEELSEALGRAHQLLNRPPERAPRGRPRSRPSVRQARQLDGEAGAA